MRKLYVLFVFVYCFVSLEAQQITVTDTFSTVKVDNVLAFKKQIPNRSYSLGYGFAMGPENLLTFIFPPKLSLNIYNKYTRFTNYYGADITGIFLFQTIYSGSVFYGWQYNKFTFDTSLSVLHVPEQDSWDGHLERHTSLLLNPKIGFRTKSFWFKIGPGFPVYNPLRDLDYKNFRSYNFEIAIHIPWGSKN